MKIGVASAYVAVATVSKILMGLITVKVIAWTIGVDGLGRLGQFMSLMAITSSLAGGGLMAGVIRYVAENKGEPSTLQAWVRAASWLSSFYVVLYGSVLLIFHKQISVALFQTPEYSWVVALLAFAQSFMALSNLLQAVINGFRRTDLFAMASSAGAAMAMAGMIAGAYFGGLPGAMVGLIWSAAIQIVPLWVAASKGLKLNKSLFVPSFSRTKSLAFTNYSIMVIASACTIPMAQIVVRNLVENAAGWTDVGQWQGMIRLSDAYLQFINILLASFYLPKLAEQKDKRSVFREVIATYKIAIPFLLFVCLTLYTLRDLAILILFTDKFVPMRDLFSWQLIGDFFKILSYVGGYVFVAKGSTKLYISAEILQAGLFIGGAYLFVPDNGALGAVRAYALTYTIYFLAAMTVLFFYFRDLATPKPAEPS